MLKPNQVIVSELDDREGSFQVESRKDWIIVWNTACSDFRCQVNTYAWKACKEGPFGGKGRTHSFSTADNAIAWAVNECLKELDI